MLHVALNDLSNKVYAANKAEDLNLSVFKMIAGIYWSKILTYECKCKRDVRKCSSDQKWNNDRCR